MLFWYDKLRTNTSSCNRHPTWPLYFIITDRRFCLEIRKRNQHQLNNNWIKRSDFSPTPHHILGTVWFYVGIKCKCLCERQVIEPGSPCFFDRHLPQSIDVKTFYSYLEDTSFPSKSTPVCDPLFQCLLNSTSHLFYSLSLSKCLNITLKKDELKYMLQCLLSQSLHKLSSRESGKPSGKHLGKLNFESPYCHNYKTVYSTQGNQCLIIH